MSFAVKRAWPASAASHKLDRINATGAEMLIISAPVCIRIRPPPYQPPPSHTPPSSAERAASMYLEVSSGSTERRGQVAPSLSAHSR